MRFSPAGMKDHTTSHHTIMSSCGDENLKGEEYPFSTITKLKTRGVRVSINYEIGQINKNCERDIQSNTMLGASRQERNG